MPLQIQQKTSPSKLDYRHYVEEGVPYKGKPLPLLNADEYANQTLRRGKAGYGCFNVHDPNEKHFGRTLAYILDKAAANEFVIQSMQEYNNSGADPEPGPPALYVFIIWYELYDVSLEDARNAAQSG